MKIADGRIDAPYLVPGSVKTLALGSGAVTQINVSPGAIGTAQLISGAVTQINVSPGAIGTAQLISGSVSEPELTLTSANAKNALRTARFAWSQAADGGGQGIVLMRGEAVPSNAMVNGVKLFVEQALAGSGAMVGIINTSGNVIIPILTSISSQMWNAPGAYNVSGSWTGLSGGLVTVSGVGAQGLELVIGSSNLTAGAFKMWLDYATYAP